MSTGDRRSVIVIPAYEPTPALVDLVADLNSDGRTIVVIDDGSSAGCRETFARVAALSHVVLLSHAVNLGKGQALKTAFNYVLLHTPADAVGVVTADADGQHLSKDIRRVADRLEQGGDEAALILGSRTFEKSVPIRNRAGNVLTRGVFRLLIGRALGDTQTGLRGIPRAFLPELMRLETGRYEFELEMLVRATARRMPIEELPIATVYGDFAKSHFNPLRDSLRIYFVFLRFVGLSIVTAAIDYAAFAIVYRSQHNILLGTIIARAIAGLFNFTANRTLVFRSRGNASTEALKYATLVITLMTISYGLVTTLVIVLGLSVYSSKLLAEGTLFAASFALQNLVVFGGRRQQPSRARATDWDAYYRKAGLFTPLTRGVTERIVVRELSAQLKNDRPAHIAELGGGNSPFLAALRAHYPDARLTAIDTNASGLELFKARFPADARVTALQRDVLAPVDTPLGADVVFSIGLIEHFYPAGTAKAIRTHFDHAKPGAVVLITYPTPTWLYRAVRGVAEAAGIWAFPDERPLTASEVLPEVERHGQVLRSFINWPIVLTQGVVVARKR
jgi:glycosyltransferase involved in cell wall biosynthesis/SAM-dependent methyltransferase